MLGALAFAGPFERALATPTVVLAQVVLGESEALQTRDRDSDEQLPMSEFEGAEPNDTESSVQDGAVAVQRDGADADEAELAQTEEDAAGVDDATASVLAFVEPCRDGGCIPKEEVEFTSKDLRRIQKVLPYISTEAARYGVDPALVSAVIWVESRYFMNARGPEGAEGLMQLMPVTSKSLAKLLDCKPAPWSASFSVKAGTLFLSRLLARTNGDEIVALAAYSRGLPRVQRYIAEGRPLPAGTRKYIGNVQRAKAAFERAFADGRLKLPKPKVPPRKPQGPLA